jgi:amidase
MGYDRNDALGLAGLVRSGKVSALELADEAIARIERLNPTLNAVITPMYAHARCRAGETLTGPFAGVPFLVKDLMVFMPGVPLSNGSAAMRTYVPAQECAQARAIREAGFVVVGKTNTAELGNNLLTVPRAFGPTANPWRTTLNSGGSSGGSTAAVAARIVPMASASDGGGSIRLPASYCGIFGLKPSRGANPHDSADAWGGALVSHTSTLSVRDSAAWLDWTAARRVAADPARPVPHSYLAAAQTPPRRLRIGMCTVSPSGGPVHGDCIAAVEDCAELLSVLGHHVEPCPLPYDGRALLKAHVSVVMAHMARGLADMAAWLGKPVGQLDVELPSRALAELGRGVGEAQLYAARAAWEHAAQAMHKFHRDYDLLLTPVVPMPPLPHGALDPSLPERLAMAFVTHTRLGRHLFGETFLDRAIDTAVPLLPFTALANATGQPAMSVPLYWTADGLPIGSQLVAPRGEDALLFAVAAELEVARPWARRRPPVCAAKA